MGVCSKLLLTFGAYISWYKVVLGVGLCLVVLLFNTALGGVISVALGASKLQEAGNYTV